MWGMGLRVWSVGCGDWGSGYMARLGQALEGFRRLGFMKWRWGQIFSVDGVRVDQ